MLFSAVEKFDRARIGMVYSARNRRFGIIAKLAPYLVYVCRDVKTAGFVIVAFTAYRLPDFIGNHFNASARASADSRVYGSATGMPHYDDERDIKVRDGVLDASEYGRVSRIARYADGKQLAYAREKNIFGDYPRIGARNNYSVGLLTVIVSIQPYLR